MNKFRILTLKIIFVSILTSCNSYNSEVSQFDGKIPEFFRDIPLLSEFEHSEMSYLKYESAMVPDKRIADSLKTFFDGVEVRVLSMILCDTTFVLTVIPQSTDSIKQVYLVTADSRANIWRRLSFAGVAKLPDSRMIYTRGEFKNCKGVLHHKIQYPNDTLEFYKEDFIVTPDCSFGWAKTMPDSEW